MVFLLLFIGRFDHIGGGVECVLGHLPSEVGMVTPSEDFFNVMFSVGVGSNGIIPGVFAIVTHWCVHGAKRMCVGAVGFDDVWIVCVGVDGTWSAVALNVFTNLCKASPWRPWNVGFSFLIFWIARVSVVAIIFCCIHQSFY